MTVYVPYRSQRQHNANFPKVKKNSQGSLPRVPRMAYYRLIFSHSAKNHHTSESMKQPAKCCHAAMPKKLLKSLSFRLISRGETKNTTYKNEDGAIDYQSLARVTEPGVFPYKELFGLIPGEESDEEFLRQLEEMGLL